MTLFRYLMFGSLGALVATIVNDFPAVVAAKSGENERIEQEYRRLFGSSQGADSLLRAAETLGGLKNLESLLASQQLHADDQPRERLEEVRTLIGYGDKITGCDARIGGRWSHSLFVYQQRDCPSIVAYLEQCRADWFASCQPLFQQKTQETLAKFEQMQSWPRVKHFRDFIRAHTRKLPQLTFAHNIKGPLLAFILDTSQQQQSISDEGSPLSQGVPTARQDFDRQFSRALKSVCEDIVGETKFVRGFSWFFTSQTECDKMDEQLKELYKMDVVCFDVVAGSSVVADPLYKLLVSGASKSDSPGHSARDITAA